VGRWGRWKARRRRRNNRARSLRLEVDSAAAARHHCGRRRAAVQRADHGRPEAAVLPTAAVPARARRAPADRSRERYDCRVASAVQLRRTHVRRGASGRRREYFETRIVAHAHIHQAMDRVPLWPLERAYCPIVKECAALDAEDVHDEAIQAALTRPYQWWRR